MRGEGEGKSFNSFYVFNFCRLLCNLGICCGKMADFIGSIKVLVLFTFGITESSDMVLDILEPLLVSNIFLISEALSEEISTFSDVFTSDFLDLSNPDVSTLPIFLFVNFLRSVSS